MQLLNNVVHTIDDDMANETLPSASNTIFAVYQPTEKTKCPIYEADLQTLAPTEMLNDTIIDFYMNYILHNIMNAEQ